MPVTVNFLALAVIVKRRGRFGLCTKSFERAERKVLSVSTLDSIHSRSCDDTEGNVEWRVTFFYSFVFVSLGRGGVDSNESEEEGPFYYIE